MYGTIVNIKLVTSHPKYIVLNSHGTIGASYRYTLRYNGNTKSIRRTNWTKYQETISSKLPPLQQFELKDLEKMNRTIESAIKESFEENSSIIKRISNKKPTWQNKNLTKLKKKAEKKEGNARDTQLTQMLKRQKKQLKNTKKQSTKQEKSLGKNSA